MARLINSVPHNRNGQLSGSPKDDSGNGHRLHLNEVAGILRIGPEEVLALTEANAAVLSEGTGGESMHYSHSDLAVLINAQQNGSSLSTAPQPDTQLGNSQHSNGLHNNSSDDVSDDRGTAAQTEAEQVPNEQESQFAPPPEWVVQSREQSQSGPGVSVDEEAVQEGSAKEKPTERLSGYIPSNADLGSLGQEDPDDRTTVQSANQPSKEAIADIPTSELAQGEPKSDRELPLSADHMLGEMISTVASSQQSVLNVQDSIREMLNVIAQDNFNLKHENRKLRERMLELERILSEHQRREETRKEMLESRMRAVEGTLSALQQQLAQLVQLQRQRIRKNWFK